MKKRLVSLLVIMTMLCAFVPVVARAYTGTKYGNYLYYEVNDDSTVTITDCDESATSITIPSTINGRYVTSIGFCAFENCKSLVNINIPSSITTIDTYAFRSCSLTSITIPGSVSNIGYFAFYFCSSLESITIQNGVDTIDSGAFGYCSSLESITIPNSVTTIGYRAFEGCNSLESITIPDSVTTIENDAFQYCRSLNNITIPDSITMIGDGAFFDTAYYNNQDNWENSVLYIGRHLIRASWELENEYKIKPLTKTIASGAFTDCTSLNSIGIPDSVTTIGSHAFSGCIGLTSVMIPDSVTIIESRVFNGCTSLTNININSSNQNYCSQNGILYNKNKSEILCYPEGKTDKSYVIPNTITVIREFAFEDCTSLISVTMPNSVVSIGNGAFVGCTSLKSITMPNNMVSIGNSIFTECTSLTSICIPNGITVIGNFAFRDCSGLTSVTIPSSVTSIDHYAFSGCESLTDVYYSGTESEWKAVSIGQYNQRLTNATIHYNSSGIPQGTFGSTNSTSNGAPIIESIYLSDSSNIYDITKTAVNIEEGSTASITLDIDVNWNGNTDGEIYITQGTKKSIEVPNGKLTFKPGEELSAGKTVYVLAIDKTTGKSTSTQVKLKINGKNNISWDPSTGINKLDFKIGKNTSFTIPDSVVFPFGGMEIGFGLDFIPITFEYESENKINIAFGLDSSNVDETTGRFRNFSWKDYKETLKSNMKKSHNGYTAAKNNEKLIKELKKKNPNIKFDKIKFNVSKGMDMNTEVTGYAEMCYVDGGWHFNEGFLALNAEVSYSYQGQVFIWVVPCYYEFGGEIGAGIEGTLKDIKVDGFEPKLEGYITAKVGASIGGGVGVAKVCTLGAEGSGSLNLKTALHESYVKAWGEGDADFKVKVLGKTVASKKFAHGEFTIYETGNSKALIKDKNAVTLQSISDDYYDTIDINSTYENESRNYANNLTEWVGDEAQITLMSADYTNKNLNKLASNIYTEAKPQICEIDGKKIMVMQWDNKERADSDRTMLVYSVYDDTNGTWSTPVAVDDDGTADFYPCFKDGYLVWQNEKTTLTDDMTLKEIAKLGEIYVTKWNGNGFDEAVALTDDNTLDTQPSVFATSSGASVIWTANTEGDILGITGKNNIIRSDFNGTSWSTSQTIKSNLNSITNITAGTVNNEFAVAYVVDDDNDLNTIDDRDIRIIRNSGETRLTNNDVIDSNPVFADNKIYYYSEGNIAYSDIDGANKQTVFEEAKPGLTDSFVVDSNANGDTAIWWTKAENGGAEVYASLYTDNAWSDEIQITSVGNEAKYPSGILNNNGSMIIAFNSGIMSENEITRTDLYTIFVNPSYDIEITDAYFDEDSMTAYATIKNSGELEISSYTVTFTGNNSTTITEPLKAGENAEIELAYNKPQDLTASTIELAVSIDGDEYNTDNNTVSFEIGHADIVVDNAAVNEAETVVSADISNTGYTNAQNVTVSLRDGSAEGSVIATKTTSLAVGDEKSVTFDIDKSALRFMDATKTLYVTSEINEDEVSLGNNDSYVLITSTSGYADYEIEVLDYNEIDGKYVINSVARNNTSSDVSCKLYTAVYSSDGTLKGCGSVDADIEADNDTGVDITVSCTIEETDIIKTFMWSDVMTPLTKVADLTIEAINYTNINGNNMATEKQIANIK